MAGRDLEEQRPARPEAKTIIDTIVEAMHRGVERFDAKLSYVPSHYEVLLHREALLDLGPVLALLKQQAALRLDNELALLNRTGIEHRVLRVARWAIHTIHVKRVRLLFQAVERRIRPNQYRRADKAWHLRISQTLNESDIDYVGVIAMLAPKQSADVAGPSTRRLTVRNTDGSFRTRPLEAEAHALEGAAAVVSEAEGTTIAETQTHSKWPFNDADRKERELARLSFRDDTGTCTYVMTTREMAVGRAGAGYEWVQLQLNTQTDVSREHVRLKYDPTANNFFIKDVSRFGTTINGRRIPSSTNAEHKDDLERWEPLPRQAEIGLADGVLVIHFESLV